MSRRKRDRSLVLAVRGVGGMFAPRTGDCGTVTPYEGLKGKRKVNVTHEEVNGRVDGRCSRASHV